MKLLFDNDKKPTSPKGMDFSNILASDSKNRIKETKTILLTMRNGEKPEVVFTGFWNGSLIRSAENAISRAYRRLRFKPTKGEGDGRLNTRG